MHTFPFARECACAINENWNYRGPNFSKLLIDYQLTKIPYKLSHDQIDYQLISWGTRR